MTSNMPKNDQPKSASNRTDNVGLQFYTNQRVSAALVAFLESLPQDRRPKKKAVLETALIEYLERNGFPPQPEVTQVKSPKKG